MATKKVIRDPFLKEQAKIAKKTLKMNDVMVKVMGGMTKAEARAILNRLKRGGYKV